MFARKKRADSKAAGEAAAAGGGDNPGSDLLTWQEQVQRDIKTHGAKVVVQAMAETAVHTDERKYSAEALAALKWAGRAEWALPRALAIDPNELRLIDGVYFRTWACELYGVMVDGHIYVDRGSGVCQVCGL